MRKVAPPLLLVVWTAVNVPAARAIDNETSVGKRPEAEVTATAPAKANGEAASPDETPNQRRRRLGQPIVASYPAPAYGESLETPNQRRRRLGQPLGDSFPPVEYGKAEPTPNQLRAGATAKVERRELQ